MTSRNKNPQWWQLYVGLPVLVGLFLPETTAALTETEHVIAELGILFLIFGFVQLWLRANRSALIHMGEEQGGWRVNIHELPATQLRELEQLEERPAARPMLRNPTREIAGVLSDTFEWGVPEDESSVFADRRAVRRKE